jgi:sugar transferase (PEP-CTERM/EpsH1 system associated)
VRLLVLAPRFPWPLDKGDRLTVFNLLKHFAAEHEVALVCFDDGGAGRRRHVDGLVDRVETVALRRVDAYARSGLGLLGRTPLQVHYYRSGRMDAAVQRVVAEWSPDIVYAHTIRMAEYAAGLDGVPTVLAMQIAMALNYGRMAKYTKSPLWKALYTIEARRARRYEPAVARLFDLCLLISEADVAALGPERPPNVLINPHGVDFEHFTADPAVEEEEGHIVFTGNMAYPPNVDAALWFASDILPLVQEHRPDARFSIVGTDPTPAVLAAGERPSVTVTGRVDDMRPWLDRAQVAVDPLRIGAGLQNKILEGMAMGVPMVVTSTANEGIGATPGEEIVVADDARSFADAVLGLFDDAERRVTMGERARRFIEEHWSWETHFADLERAMASLVGGR